MNKNELFRRVCEVICSNDIKKPVSIPKRIFHISDGEGTTKDFTVKEVNKNVSYTFDDVKTILETCVEVIEDAIKHGDRVSFGGFGSLGVLYRKPSRTRHPITREYMEVTARCLPKFKSGKDLKMSAKVYEMSLNERLWNTQDDEDSILKEFPEIEEDSEEEDVD